MSMASANLRAATASCLILIPDGFMHPSSSSSRSSLTLRTLAVAALLVHAACGDAPTAQTPPPPDAGVAGVSNPGSTVCARDAAGVTWCSVADAAGNFRITRAEAAPGTGTGTLPIAGVLTVYNPDCQGAGKAVDRGGAQRNGGDWLDVHCRPDGCAAALPGLLAWYPFDDAGADFTADQPNAAPASALALHGVTRESGRVLGGLRFSGSGWAEGAAGKNVGTGDFSIALWLRVNPNDAGAIISVLDKRVLSPYRGYHLALYFGEPLLQLADGAPPGEWTNYHSAIDAGRVADGAWHFVVVTVERAPNPAVRWYLDGATAGFVGNPFGRPGSLDSDSPLVLGRRSFSSDGWMTGMLDELQIATRVLTPAEVSALYTRHTCR